MKYIIMIALTAVISYLLGSCNSAIIFVRLLKGEDVRNFGSGNAGLTNTLRCFGKLPALLTLIGDLAKGVIAVFLCSMLASKFECGLSPNNEVQYIVYVAGFFAMIGHIFPIYYKFKGGKGVLVGVSIFLAIDPLVFGIVMLIFIITLIITHYVSVSSMTAALFVPIATFFAEKYFYVNDRAMIYAIMTLPMIALVIFMHRSNIERLKNGTENRFSFKSSGKEK